jgi:hypothetical protein
VQGFEAAFFESNFSHSNIADGNLVRHPKGIYGYWRDMTGARIKRIPYRLLKPISKTVRNVIEGKTDERN